jgi:hypothetical protein
VPAPHLALTPWTEGDLPIPNGSPWPSASAHSCKDCTECPHCLPLHAAWVRANEDETALGDPSAWAAFEAELKAVGAYLQMAAAQIRAASDWWAAIGMYVIALQSQIDEFWADFGSMLDVGLDANHVSFTPRQGWILITPAPGLRVWVSNEDHIEEVMRALTTSQLLDQLGALNAEYNSALQQRTDAEAAHNGCKSFYDVQTEVAKAWGTAQVQRWNDARRECRARQHQTLQASKACLRTCRTPKRADNLVSLLVAGGLLFAGVGAVMVGQPFDTVQVAIAQPAVPSQPSTGSTAVASTVAITPPPKPDDQPPPETPADTVIDPPAMTSDEVQLDLLMQEWLGISAAPGEFISFMNEPEAAIKFGLPATDPFLRSSFYAEPLTELGMETNLGPVPMLSQAGTAWMTFDSPITDPQVSVFERYAPLADLAVPAERFSFSPSQAMLAVGVTINTDITDPAYCSGRGVQLALNITSPNRENVFQAGSSFPGDFYDGGDYFPGVFIGDCEASTYLDAADQTGRVSFGFDSPGSALFTVRDGMTHGLIMIPDEYVRPDATIHTIFFEYDTAAGYTPSTTRYQSVPDMLGPPALLTDGINTVECDFTLGPTVVPAATTSTTSTSTSTTTTSTTTTLPAPTGAGGAPVPPPGGGGTDTGGGQPPIPPTGGESGGGGTTPGPVDTDDTNLPLILTGLGLAAVGAGFGTTELATRRRREEDEVYGPPQAPTGAPPDPSDTASTKPTSPPPTTQRPSSTGSAPVTSPGTTPAQPVPTGTSPSQPQPSADQQRQLSEAIQNADAARAAATTVAIDKAAANVTEARQKYLSAVASYDARVSAEANEGALESLHDWYTNKNKTEQKLLATAATRMAQALDSYRTAVSQYVAIRLLTVPADQRSTILGELESQAATQARQAETRARTDIESVIMKPKEDRVRSATIAARRADMQSAAVFGEVLKVARSRLPAGAGRSDTFAVLDGLASEVRDTRRDRERQPGMGKGAKWWEETEAHYRMREWLRDTERDLRVDTFVAVAEQATIIDSRTGLPITDDLRKKVAADKIAWLSEYLRAASWRRDDTRFTKSAELAQRLETSYKALSYLGYGHVSMAEYFLATGSAIRSRQSDVNTWFLSDYLGFKDYLGSKQGEDTGSNWRMAWASANIGIGTKGRVMGYGDDNIESVKKRIESMNDDADIAVLALQTAAKVIHDARTSNKPLTWPTGTVKLPNGDVVEMSQIRELLVSFGYLVPSRDGTIQFRMPTADHTVARSTSIKLPGASWLDVVSARSAAEVLLSVAVPELAGARLAAMVSRAGISGARLATVVRVLADQGIGLAMDVGFTYAKTDAAKRNLTKIAGESLINNVAGLISRAGTGRLAKAGVDSLSASPRLTKMLADPETRALATRFLSEALGVPGDAMSQLIVQSANGHKISTDDLLSALLGSAMNRYLGRVSTGTINHPKLKSLLSPDLHTVAMHVDKHLNDEAGSVFKDVVKDAPLTTETGTRVFEALRRGDLSWEQLQRVFSIRGDEMASVMSRVNDLRNELVASIGTRARVIARNDVVTHFDTLIEAAPDRQTADRLRSEKQAELDKIGDPNSELRVAARFTSDALEFSSMSRDELVARLRTTDVAKGADLESMNLIALQDMAMRDLETTYTDAVRKAAGDEIAPGSAGPTSDVDRSWSSEFLRNAARKVVLVEMTRGRLDGESGPSTARAFDVNEYVNVMTRIPSMMANRKTFESRVIDTITLTRNDGSTETHQLIHSDAVEANSFAAAMLHMDSERRSQFERNKTEGLTGSDRTRIEAMFVWAKRTLHSSETELRAAVDRERAKGGRRSESEIELRARDDLYGERMRELDRLGHEIDSTTDPARRAELMSKWELAMNKALRDGIETYSDMANLELIVIRIQSQKKADGTKYTPEELMRSDDFRLGSKALDGVTPQQIRSMLNDQILMFMHHLHTLHSGDESPAKATRSLAKYAERALLALNLLGEFDPATKNKYSDLFDATKALMEHKNNPKKLLETLETLRPGQGKDAASNLRWYLNQLELIPGMKDLTKDPNSSSQPRAYNDSLARRQWLRAQQAAIESGADVAWKSAVMSDLSFTALELIEVEQELRTAEALREFLPGDRYAATKLLEGVDELTYRTSIVRSDRYIGPRYKKLSSDLRLWSQRLAELKQRWIDAGRPGDAEAAGRIDRLRRRKEGLAAAQRRLTAELERLLPGDGVAPDAVR